MPATKLGTLLSVPVEPLCCSPTVETGHTCAIVAVTCLQTACINTVKWRENCCDLAVEEVMRKRHALLLRGCWKEEVIVASKTKGYRVEMNTKQQQQQKNENTRQKTD